MDDLELAFDLANAADEETLSRWNSGGVASTTKPDGTPVTEADSAAEQAIVDMLQDARPKDRYLGEELGELAGTTDRRWIVDGIDGTRFFAAGERTWGTLIALEVAGDIVLGVSSSPAKDQRWWATLGGGSFTAPISGAAHTRRIQVAPARPLTPDHVTTLPAVERLDRSRRAVLGDLAGGSPLHQPWSQQLRVAEGEIDLCVWFAGDTWDHAAPSIIVEEAGGRFSDHFGGQRLDTRTAIYSNGACHDDVVAALAAAATA